MKGNMSVMIAAAATAALLVSGCGGSPDVPSAGDAEKKTVQIIQDMPTESGLKIDGDTALEIALENAGVPREDADNIKVEQDSENDISIYQVEFETAYGDYDFEIAVSDGLIIGADYEVDEEWLDRLGGSPVTEEEAMKIVSVKAEGASAHGIRMWEESNDGRTIYEGEFYHNGIKYEFELDGQTGRIFDWNADLRE